MDFVQRYKIGINWNINGQLFLRHKGKKIAWGQLTMDNSLTKISTDEENETEQKLHLIITNTVTIPPHHISFFTIKSY